MTVADVHVVVVGSVSVSAFFCLDSDPDTDSDPDGLWFRVIFEAG
jgi:hypothetical protein